MSKLYDENLIKAYKNALNESKEYDDFFRGMLKKYKITSPDELSKDQKKKFFDEIDKQWISKKEKEK